MQLDMSWAKLCKKGHKVWREEREKGREREVLL